MTPERGVRRLFVMAGMAPAFRQLVRVSGLPFPKMLSVVSGGWLAGLVYRNRICLGIRVFPSKRGLAGWRLRPGCRWSF